MSLEEITARVCNLARDSRQASMLQLITDSGAKNCPGALAHASLSKCLRNNPDLIADWLLQSADKRVSSGWYFIEESDQFIVGFHPDGERLCFNDPVAACAEFVIREVNDLMKYCKP